MVAAVPRTIKCEGLLLAGSCLSAHGRKAVIHHSGRVVRTLFAPMTCARQFGELLHRH